MQDHIRESIIDRYEAKIKRLRRECDYLMGQMEGQREAEREACARVADFYTTSSGWQAADMAEKIAAAIRARGNGE